MTRFNKTSFSRIGGKHLWIEVGGYTDTPESRILEVYDPTTDSWSQNGESPRYFKWNNYVVHEDQIYVFTGYQSPTHLMYIHGKGWREVEQDGDIGYCYSSMTLF